MYSVPNNRLTLMVLIGLVLISTACTATDSTSDSPKSAAVSGPSTDGKWDMVDIPKGMRINAIHSVVLPTGDVLLIAGSGNDQEQFDAGTFETLLYTPSTGDTERIDTPEDLFCAGHAHLPNGNLLVAGGTQAYEVAENQLTHAGGVLTLVNETPSKEFYVPEGTEVTGVNSGETYRTDSDITIPMATIDPTTNDVTPSQRNVYITALVEGEAGVYGDDSYDVAGLTGDDALNLHGYATGITFDKKDYQGIKSAYEFDPWKRAYIKVDPMHYARWYPTLTAMSDGQIITLSGLDGSGKILDGQTEVYDPESHTWTERPDLQRMFPTYPSVFQTDREDVLFSAGANGGWGPEDQGREPGFWNLGDNSFDVVPGLRDPELLETGAAGWLGPVNDQRLIVVGGGSIGDTPTSTGRIDMVDLNADEPRFVALEDLPQGTRYPNIVTLPTGDVFITNGSTGYRGRGNSDILKSYLLDQQNGSLTELAEPGVGRNYHSTALLLPNGQVLVTGSDPLFADAGNTTPGDFEKRIEIYTPPYLLNKDGTAVDRPKIDQAPATASHGQQIDIALGGANDIAYVRLLYPGAVTHVTDTNQRLVELEFSVTEDGVTATIPDNPALAPPAHYMLVVLDKHGVPSEATWIQVSHEQMSGSQQTSSHH